MGTVDLEGQTWDLHVGNNGDMKVFSFVAGSELGTWEGDVKKFYNYITESQGFPADQQHLISECLNQSLRANHSGMGGSS